MNASLSPVLSDTAMAFSTTGGKLRSVPMASIILDGCFSVRDRLDEAAIQRYVECFDELPPPVGYERPEGILLVARRHRVEAARRLGRAEVWMEVRQGPDEEALELALLDNLRHGKPLTRAERRRVIARWLRLHLERSNAWIARDLGVSDGTVETVRRELEATSQISRLDKLVGEDGRERPRRLGADEEGDTVDCKPADPLAFDDYDDQGCLHPRNALSVAYEDVCAGRPASGERASAYYQVYPQRCVLGQANAIQMPLPDGSVHMAAFSPPYWGMRQYKGAQGIVWPPVEHAMPGGVVRIPGDPQCEHEWEEGRSRMAHDTVTCETVLSWFERRGFTRWDSPTGNVHFMTLVAGAPNSAALSASPARSYVADAIAAPLAVVSYAGRHTLFVNKSDGLYMLEYNTTAATPTPTPTDTATPTETATPIETPTPVTPTPTLVVQGEYESTLVVTNDVAGLTLRVRECSRVAQIGSTTPQKGSWQFVVCQVTLHADRDAAVYSGLALAVAELGWITATEGWWPPGVEVMGGIGDGSLLVGDEVSGKVAGIVNKGSITKKSSPCVVWEQAGTRYIILFDVGGATQAGRRTGVPPHRASRRSS